MDRLYARQNAAATRQGPSAVFERRTAGNFRRRRGPALIDILLTWQGRAMMRADLAALEGRLLADVGLTRRQARAEAAKPFWRA
jgi:uncharacterized protein YjiS (DUF1127 family)